MGQQNTTKNRRGNEKRINLIVHSMVENKNENFRLPGTVFEIFTEILV